MLVFDADALVAYYRDDPGSDRIEQHLQAVETGEARGGINTVTCTQVHTSIREDDEQLAGEYVSRIRDWFQVVGADSVWEEASYFKYTYEVCLSAAYTLATAADRDATAVVSLRLEDAAIDDVAIEQIDTPDPEPE